MDTIISIAILGAAVGTITETSIITPMAGGSPAILTVIPAAVIAELIGIDEVWAGAISTAVVASWDAEITIISGQAGFTPTRQAGIGFFTVELKSVS